MKKSKWFDGAKFVPAHVGVYEVDHMSCFVEVYQYWNDKFWGAYAPTPDRAVLYAGYKSDYQNLKWRGIKK